MYRILYAVPTAMGNEVVRGIICKTFREIVEYNGKIRKAGYRRIRIETCFQNPNTRYFEGFKEIWRFAESR